MAQETESNPISNQETRRTLTWRFTSIVRIAIAGILMGLANLVPGISGGTMILVMGLYEEFVDSVADVTRLKFSIRNTTFLVLLIVFAGGVIIALSGWMSLLVQTHRMMMYSIFIGLTLGGAPLLYRMMRPIRPATVMATLAGLSVMTLIAVTRSNHEPLNPSEQQSGAVILSVQPHYALDFLAGALGMSAMVLPGISGAYMLLVVGRYESLFASIDLVKRYILGQPGGDPAGFAVLIPVALGAVICLVLFSNLLKWLLHQYEKPTLGFLLGILLGSIVGIWPFDQTHAAQQVSMGILLIVVGFAVTFALSFLSDSQRRSHR